MLQAAKQLIGAFRSCLRRACFNVSWAEPRRDGRLLIPSGSPPWAFSFCLSPQPNCTAQKPAMLPISLLFTALAVGATVHLPIHLQPHPMVRRSTPVDGFAPFKLPVTQKQDTCFLSPSFSDPSYLAAIAEKVADNQNMLSAALAAGKAKPPFSLEAVGAMSPIPVPIKKRDGGWNWATSKIRGVNLGGWLVLEVRPRVIRMEVPADLAPSSAIYDSFSVQCCREHL